MTRQRNHRSDYERRNERARAEGFRSYADKRRHGGADAAYVRNEADFVKLPRTARQERRRALRALADIRKDGVTAEQAALRNETSVEAIRFWSGGALLSAGGVTRADRLWRPMEVIDATTHSKVPVDVRGSRVASRIGTYWDAVDHYRETGDTGPLVEFRGVRIGGIELETDPDVIDRLTLLGVLSFETIYRDVAA